MSLLSLDTSPGLSRAFVDYQFPGASTIAAQPSAGCAISPVPRNAPDEAIFLHSGAPRCLSMTVVFTLALSGGKTQAERGK